ncbi:MAG: DUF2155 domain-containing protein [Acetobacter sp.]|nr:DUF2155 domain-containing protein [Acetobacter sp.]
MTVKNKFQYTAIVCSLLAYSSQAAEIPTNAALMQAMDKVTGRVNKITVPVNSKISFGDFSLVLRACKKRPAEETPENFAFVDVTDKSFGTEEYNIFRGWMLSSTPGINAIEHPIYDVWLLECIDTEVDASKLLNEEELAQRDKLPAKSTLIEQETAVEMPKEDAIDNDKQKVIRIKEFINEDRDIEKDIHETPAYISETSTSYVSDIEEGAEPENLLLFTKMQEESSAVENTEPKNKVTNSEDDLVNAIDAEINGLHKN